MTFASASQFHDGSFAALVYWGLLNQGYITLGYRGTFAIGRGDMSTTGFRKLTRLLVCGKSALCREVFKVRARAASTGHCGSFIDAGHTQRKQRSWQRSGWRQVGSWLPKHYHRNWVMSFIDDITSPYCICPLYTIWFPIIILCGLQIM